MQAQTDNVLQSINAQLGNLFKTSGQAMYAYVDDRRKVCNRRMADLLGYASPEAWAAVTTSFPEAFVQPDSQETLVEAYQDAIQHGVGCAIPITWKRKDGKEVDTDVVLVPLDFGGQRVALHFIEPVAEE
ncbi:MAG TPA: PAS domain-containing protein [Candidatus Thermoplasmatota archaeon]|nr:PAS domain-containing protein [Candidatus Thermoplasmatota archaeon]